MLKDSKLNRANLSTQQNQIISSDKKKILITGHAGTGKTSCLSHIAKKWIVEEGISPSRILVMSYDQKMGRPLLSRIEELIGEENCSGISVHSAGSLCQELLKLYQDELGFGDYLEMDFDCYRLTLELANLTSSGPLGSECGLNTLSAVNILTFMTEHQCSLRDALILTREGSRWDEDVMNRLPQRIAYCEKAIHSYQLLKGKLNAYTEQDLIQVITVCLENNESLRRKITSTYDHFICDNIEEMTPLGLRFMRALVGDNYLVCVGDTRQAFLDSYGVCHLDQNLVPYYFPGITTFCLNQSYRFCPSACNLANWLMNQSPFNSRYIAPIVPASNQQATPPVKMICGETKEKVSTYIASLIQQHKENGGEYSDIMILGHNRWEMFDIQKVLSREKIPYKCIDSTDPSRTSSNHLRYFTSGMRIASNWRNASAWWNFMSVFQQIDELDTNISLDLIKQIICCDSKESALRLFEKSGFSSKAASLLRDFLSNDDPVIAVEIAKKVILPFLLSYYDKSIKKVMHDIDRLENQAYMYDSINDYVRGCINRMAAEYPKEVDKDAVVISSFYRAKTEQAKICIIMDAGNDLWPKRWNFLHGESTTESQRRLLYSAMVKASENLILCKVPERDFGICKDKGFLKDVPTSLLEIENIQ